MSFNSIVYVACLLISFSSSIPRLLASDPSPTSVCSCTGQLSLSIDQKCRVALALLSANFNPAAPELTPGLHGALKVAVATINQVRESLEDESVVFDGSLSNQLAEEVGAIIICFPRLIHRSVITAMTEYNCSFARPTLVVDPSVVAAQEAFLKLSLRTGFLFSEGEMYSEVPVPEAVLELSEESAASFTTEEKVAFLFQALSSHNFNDAETVFCAGADLHFLDKDGRALIHYAVRLSNYGMIEWLLNHGADINLPTRMGPCGIFIALMADNFDLADWLFSKGARLGFYEVILLHGSAFDNQQKVIEWLIRHGVDINTPTDDGTTILDRSECCGHCELTAWLVSQGAKRF